MISNQSVAFFDEQFQRQPRDVALKLNPFEELALPYLCGEVLDFGCGMGNLAFAAAHAGCTVTALDASPVAVEHIRSRSARERAAITVSLADLRDYPIQADYDCVVSIGLLMFFGCPTAFKVLSQLQSHVRPGGIAVINVLIEGTTYLAMFDPSGHCLFTPAELQERFTGWRLERIECSTFEAPLHTVKRFCTVIARKPTAELNAQA